MNIKWYIIILITFIGVSSLFPQSIIINEVMSSNQSTITDEDGDYSDWIEIFNSADNQINLSQFSLSDDINIKNKWTFPDINLNPKSYLLIFASGKNRIGNYLHTNFKISSDGEKLWLNDSSGIAIDELDSILIPTDLSIGRNISNPSDWLFYKNPTPGSENNQNGFSAICKIPVFTLEAGFYGNTINLEITKENANENIYYTTDGSTPTLNSVKYSSAIMISKTTVIKAKCFGDGLLSSKIVTKTYFVNEEFTLPVVSLSTDPNNFWDEQNGIYVDGTNGISGPCSAEPKNYNQDWEKPLTFEFFETDKSPAINIAAGVKIYGGCSRTYPQKSLAIYARKKYGFNSIKYPIFPKLPFTEYEAIILRNSGDDFYSSFMRDGLMHSIVENLDLETQAYRPAIVFINGEYWGIHNIREKINENFIAQHHDVDPDNLDILELNRNVISGDAINYNEMINYIENNDVSSDQVYNNIQSMMDTDNFISYCVSQIYFDNTDWPGHNIKYWRLKDNGRWRWMLYDTDFGFGFKSVENYTNNTLEFATTANGQTNANQPWSTLLLRKLLENQKFKEKFINTFADYSNTIFKPELVKEKITSISAIIQPEIPKHIEKWGEYPVSILYPYWLNNVNNLKKFADNRLSNLQDHFKTKFGLGEMAQVSLSTNLNDFGSIKINSLNIDNFPWSGDYFIGNKITLAAQNKLGYAFIGWSVNGSIISSEKIIELNVTEGISITAMFELNNSLLDKILINEINYNSSAQFNCGDWIEITNASDSVLNISNWNFRDSKDENIFKIPENTFLNAHEYLVISEDTSTFNTFYSEIKNVIGNFNFKLSNEGETLRIFDNYNLLIDSVNYGINVPWPSNVNGTGYTLELINTESDNSIPQNWSASNNIGGTPGKQNSSYDPTNINDNISQIPSAYSISQNYPNPFNPTTTIKYSIPTELKSQNSKVQNVTLLIYDLLGREVQTLVNQDQKPGNYVIKWNASKQPSGVYFYKIHIGNFVDIKKMILIK